MNSSISWLILFGLLGLVAIPCQAEPKPTGDATSVTFFEIGNGDDKSSSTYSSDGQWTLLHPLRINHNSGAYGQRRPYVKPKVKLMSQSVSGPAGYTKEYFGNLIPEVDTPRSYGKALRKKKYLVKQIASPPVGRQVTFVHPYPSTFPQPSPPKVNPQAQGVNVQKLINKFGLVSMKPLLNPQVARQQVPPEPSLQALESRLLLTPFTFYKANQMFVPLNNQPIAIKTVALALQQARQGAILLNAHPPTVDSDLISLLNRSARKYGFEGAAAEMFAATNELFDNKIPSKQNSWKRMDSDESVDGTQGKEAKREEHGLELFGPDFRRLTKSRRMRTTTLGALGY